MTDWHNKTSQDQGTNIACLCVRLKPFYGCLFFIIFIRKLFLQWIIKAGSWQKISSWENQWMPGYGTLLCFFPSREGVFLIHILYCLFFVLSASLKMSLNQTLIQTSKWKCRLYVSIQIHRRLFWTHWDLSMVQILN